MEERVVRNKIQCSEGERSGAHHDSVMLFLAIKDAISSTNELNS